MKLATQEQTRIENGSAARELLWGKRRWLAKMQFEFEVEERDDENNNDLSLPSDELI